MGGEGKKVAQLKRTTIKRGGGRAKKRKTYAAFGGARRTIERKTDRTQPVWMVCA